ncbi:MAG: pseudouridine-5'-phosphate glycosidase [Acholeplasmataceae bacterium]
MHNSLVIRPDILEAMIANRPIVALESTIISHGMPYPENITMAKKVEEIIIKNGAVPATIAIMDGKIKIGLTDNELETLAKSKDVIKVSKRDFGYVLSQKKIGATTVSATMIACELAGISVFATGGIGGVHRGAQETFDISRDLEELASTNVCVVCAGAKSILDLSLTLEYLETKGVEVIGYKTKMLPAFYTNESQYQVDYQLDTPEDIAHLISSKWQLGIKGGILVANPIPDMYSMDAKTINQTIDEAILKAQALNIKGKETTPFLLKEISQVTKGDSLAANLELVYHNADLASKIAVAYSEINR